MGEVFREVDLFIMSFRAKPRLTGRVEESLALDLLMNQKIKIQSSQRTLLVGIRYPRAQKRVCEDSLKELELLITTAGGNVVGQATQEVKRVHPATFIGKGKVEEIHEMIPELNVELVAVDEELTPVQNRNLEDAWDVRVVDRTAVILDIFAIRARTKEGKLQVELAQLEYLAPRLVGRQGRLMQQVGYIGARGPGETQLEVDRRRIRKRIGVLKGKLEQVLKHRAIHRLKREGTPVPLVSLVGYTNAGKSTLLNALTDAGVIVEEKLFSTLDPTVRRMKLASGREILLADTVGFIKKLPHQLVESFKATFEELAHADLILEVIDLSDEDAMERMRVVDEVLGELELNDRPRLTVFNKLDLCEHAPRSHDGVAISARTKQGIDMLLARIDETLRAGFRRVRMKLGHDQGEILSAVYRIGHVFNVRHFGKTVRIDCELPEKYVGKYREYLVT